MKSLVLNSPRITKIHGRELLDSRGFPALEVEVWSSSGHSASAMVPSGASTGRFEALELRDQDKKRFHGKGLLKACENVSEISKKIRGVYLESIEDIDERLIDLDGTENKSRLGANAILGVSLACLKLLAQIQKKNIYSFFKKGVNQLPIPLTNVLNGGSHANNNLDVQEFMLVPHGFSSFREALRASSEVFHTLKKDLQNKNYSTSVGDEGGVAPSLKSNEEALELLVSAIKNAGYKPGKEISLALDVAASSIYQNGLYIWEGKKIKADDLIQIYDKWLRNYPLVSIEDGLEEEEWEDWKKWSRLQGGKVQIVGDDLFVTNSKRLKKGIENKTANALLVKVNQIGTVTEAYQAVKLAHQSGYRTVLSHRSGETEDSVIADLSIAFECHQIKTGGVSRGERTAKYNRLLRIEEELGDKAKYPQWPL
ncbi:MAG: phosphopyruvate hydratase [Bdellovibrionales bacterium]|nr:phosphopyruvate hydratase [Bdellovibrionales bacterium]